ncbi:hypothetical protein [Roseibium alexandrii]|uniref:Uncharacterized protein n=1 Tax=Roseibium alexandrii (strain DSM 17067 / NCIMB 14079 / DFL-11) TaxID=244592 RepID=A0A5E8UXJ3_ROSAD|nr:hypothetical protein [Roseibium alexandrii]RMX61883.1 hypothetical protein SADFL11_00047750 [Roseibium alexandrii DFL-11]
MFRWRKVLEGFAAKLQRDLEGVTFPVRSRRKAGTAPSDARTDLASSALSRT